jgi:hypothetical protein
MNTNALGKLPLLLSLLAAVAASHAGAASATAASDPSSAATLKKLRAANLPHGLSGGQLDSYRSKVCVVPGGVPVPESGKPGTGAPALCVKAELGVAASSLAYLRVAAGGMLYTQLVNSEEGWEITAPAGADSPAGGRRVAKLAATKSDALKEQVRHSLPALFRLLGGGGDRALAALKLSRSASHVVVAWQDGASTNEFFFDGKSLLCEKQVKRMPVGVTVLKYSDYKSVSGVMLPHRIEVSAEDGRVVATQLVEDWSLAVAWPEGFFTPERVGSSF